MPPDRAAVNYYAKLRRLSGEYSRIVTACYRCAQMKVGTCPACENFTLLHVVITTNALVIEKLSGVNQQAPIASVAPSLVPMRN